MAAFLIRFLGFLTFSPLQAAGYFAVSGSAWFGIALCYVPIACGWVGLLSRPLLDVVAGRDSPRHELSAKGAILGATAAFVSLLALAPPDVDRTKLAAVFIAGSTIYYALGKCGCLAIGCCGATAARRSSIPLQAIEALSSAAVGLFAFASLGLSIRLRLAAFVATALAFGVLRISSRYARGMELRRTLQQPDSFAMASLVIVAGIAFLAQR